MRNKLVQIAILTAVVTVSTPVRAQIEVIESSEPGYQCQTVTFEGNGHNASVGPVAGTPLTFATPWRTLTDGPFANKPSGETIAFFTGTSTGQVLLSQPVARVSLFYASIPGVTLEGLDANGNVVATAYGTGNIQPDDFTRWDLLALNAGDNLISEVRLHGAGGQTFVDDFKVCVAVDPATLIENLVFDVASLNLANGIDNSLDSKLDAALNALADVNENNNVAACNSLSAFVNAVEAQSGNQIESADAEDLILQALSIMAVLCP